MVKPEMVKFGVVTQCCKNWAFVRTGNGAEVRLFWSHLRPVESACGELVFATGKSPNVRKGDKVAFVPQKEGLWLWVLHADYDTAVNFLKQNSPPPATPTVSPPVTPTPLAPAINFEQEMAALGNERVRKWQSRYSQRSTAFA